VPFDEGERTGVAVTLDDVARLGGVSRATASRALNDRYGVSPEVRERIVRLAASLGYRPNRAARNLAIGRSSVIGLVIPSSDLRVDPYGASMTHAVGRAATEADQGLMLVLDTGEPGRTVRHILRDGLLDGVLVSAVAAGEAWVEELLTAVLPTVLIGNHPTRHDVDVVDVENLESSVRLVEHLFGLGCERVAMVTGPLERVDAATRLAGFRLAHERNGRRVDERLVVAGDFGRPSGMAAGAELAELRPDGVFASNDEMALGVLRAFAESGIDVPVDIAVVGFDGTATNVDDVDMTVTSMRQPFDAIAHAAVGELLARIDGEPPTGLTLIEPEMFVGQSTARAP
jgi:LacI family transcriptional regulator